jgi:hypothetical protein
MRLRRMLAMVLRVGLTAASASAQSPEFARCTDGHWYDSERPADERWLLGGHDAQDHDAHDRQHESFYGEEMTRDVVPLLDDLKIPRASRDRLFIRRPHHGEAVDDEP